jgi:hypothetical protein
MHLFTAARAVMNVAGGAIGIIMEVRCSIGWLSWLFYGWLSFLHRFAKALHNRSLCL